jgi:HEAT repeat protein
LGSPEARAVLGDAVVQMARTHPSALSRALFSEDRVVVHEALDLVRRLKPAVVREPLEKLTGHPDGSTRAEVARTLAAIGGGQALKALAGMIGDRDVDVRIAALQALTERPYRGALRPVQEAIEAADFEERDLGEKRAFFELFGILAGDGGVALLAPIVTGKAGFGRRRASSDTRACAAVALRRIGTPSARKALTRAARDRDPVVRSAAAKALRDLESR